MKWAWIALLVVAANLLGYGVYRTLMVPRPLPDVALVDHNGKAAKWSDFRGKWLVVFFGYTSCPDACPTGLTDLDGELKRLGPDAPKIQTLFVTLDPERDTPTRLKSYLPYFNPTFMGVRAQKAELASLVEQFGVLYQKATSSVAGSYNIDHSLRFYVIDPQGQLRTSFLLPAPPAEFRKAFGLTQ